MKGFIAVAMTGALVLIICMALLLTGRPKTHQAYTVSLYQSGWLTRAYEADSVDQDGDTLTFRDRKTGAAVTVCGGWVLETKTKEAK